MAILNAIDDLREHGVPVAAELKLHFNRARRSMAASNLTLCRPAVSGVRHRTGPEGVMSVQARDAVMDNMGR